MRVVTEIELNEGETNFVLALAKGLRPTRAAQAAGYSVATARPMLHRPHVAAAIKHCAANLLDACRRIDAGT